ncbi:hypothetical protein [Estrella lausannensis]|uniref:Uncharacterized protein n=1 Tax=Estrella lausannensis TaxID=483423 RepID=A0A0H5E5A3_9BACT|nr:hypothetical protein [Estrella lausannensis]CRX38420.1 Conserved hypothetical protein [Estrella lausannensis]
MNVAPPKRNKIELSHYNFKKDIANRALLSKLNQHDIAILVEIVNGSLKISLDSLAQALDCSQESIENLAKIIEPTGLLKLEQGALSVDKDVRKYFECLLARFEEGFDPDLDHIQGLMQQVPIHVLPVWYTLPKNTDKIFPAIVEKVLHNPKCYIKHLQELPFECEAAERTIDDVHASQDLSLPSALIKEKYKLTDDAFMECMLYLEYSLLCYCVYIPKDSGFEERVVPLHEWAQLIRFQRENACNPIEKPSLIERTHPSDFGYVEELTQALKALGKEGKDPKEPLQKEIVSKLLSLSLIEESHGTYKVTQAGLEFTAKTPQEKAMTLYLSAMNRLRRSQGIYSDKDIREIERCLKRIVKTGWVLLDDFLKGACASVGNMPPVTLVKKGKRWSFALPQYNEEERRFVTDCLMGFFYESALTATGSIQGKPCFTLTPFGCSIIGE